MDTPDSEKNYELAIPTTGIERHDQMMLSASMPVTTGSSTTNITSDKGMVLKDITGPVNVTVSHNNTVVKQSAADEVNLVIKGLKKEYAEMNASLTLPWLRSEPYDMEQCFSQLETLVKVIDSSGNRIQAQCNSMKLEGIFDRVQGLKPTRIFLEDKEGILSPIVLLQLCRSWSSGCGPAVIFDLVLLLDGRNLLHKTLEEVIAQECRAKEVANDVLLKIIKEHLKVLLIFDQLPRELPWGRRTALDQMLKGTNYEAATVLVSYQTTDRYVDSENVFCGSRKSCTKVIQLHRLSFITENLLAASNQVHSLRDIEKELLNFPFLDLEKPVFVLLLMHVVLKVKFPKEQMFTFLLFMGLTSHIPIQEEIHSSIFERLVMDQFNPKYPAYFIKFNEKNIPPETLFLSRIGEYALNLLANGASHFTVVEMKNHFQEELASVLKFGFVLAKLYYSRRVYVEKLQMVHRSLMEYLIAYHVYVVYETQPREQFLLKVDLLNEFQPLHDGTSDFLCKCLANFLIRNGKSAYAALCKHRAHYSTLINSMSCTRPLNITINIPSD